MYVLCLHEFMCTTFTQDPQELELWLLWAFMWALGTKRRSPVRAVGALALCVSSVAPKDILRE